MDPDRPEAFLSEIGQATALYRYNGHWFYGCIDKWKRLWLTSGILQFAPVSYRTRVQRQIIGGPFRSGADSSFCDNSREAVLAYDSYGDPVFSGFDRKVMASIEMDALHGNFMNTQFLCCQRYQVCCRFSLRFQMYFSSVCFEDTRKSHIGIRGIQLPDGSLRITISLSSLMDQQIMIGFKFSEFPNPARHVSYSPIFFRFLPTDRHDPAPGTVFR